MMDSEKKSQIFVTKRGLPITFYVEECAKKDEVVKLIEERGGEVIEDLTEINSFTVILVEKEDFRDIYDRVVFIPEYVLDCVLTSSLLHMNAYCHIESSDNFLKIIYFREKIFDVVGFRIPQLRECERPMKVGWEPYTLEEETAIVLYLIRSKDLHRIRSNELWKSIEQRNVIRGRKWQSLRAHFSMAISRKLYKFPFLTEEEKKLLSA